MSDCCGCECGTESFEVSASPVSTDPREVVRGTTDGDFDSARPISCVIHTDWCCHRPTKAAVTVVAIGYTTCNGSVRVFVEGKRDFSQYVYAEAVVEANVEFPTRNKKHHFADDTTKYVASYTPVFGTNTGDFVFVPRDAEDGDSYLKAAWPLSDYVSSIDGAGIEVPYLSGNHYVGARLTVKCGYREDGSDSHIADFMFPASVHGFQFFAGTVFLPTLSATFPPTTVAIGCHWEDIIDEQSGGLVRCGLQLVQTESYSQLPEIASIANFGVFSFPFTVPRSLFVDADSQLNPKPADRYRYAGLAATATTVKVPRYYSGSVWQPEVDSTRPTAGDVTHYVTCAADHSSVIVNTLESDDVSVVPAAAQGGDGGPVTESSPYFVRRPDIIARVPNTVAAADSWHATHLVRRGSSLAARNAIHHLHLEFVQAAWPIAESFTGAFTNASSEWPIYTSWVGQRDWRYNQNLPNESGPQFYFWSASDADKFGLIYPNDGIFEPPDMLVWNAIAGQHELTPFVNDRRLFPNSYHVHYAEALNTYEKTIVDPNFSDIESSHIYNRIGPFTEATWADYDSREYPAFNADHRVAWTVETYPQLWATTSYNESWAYNRPLDIPLEDSGMTTENYDGYARRNSSDIGGVSPWVSWDPGVGAVISVRARVGLKYTITRVKGFRRERVKGDPGYYGNGFFYNETGAVKVTGDHECNDVACTEVVSDFKIPLDGSDLEAISEGEEVTKQLLVGYLREPTEEDNGDPVYRTVKVKVTKEE